MKKLLRIVISFFIFVLLVLLMLYGAYLFVLPTVLSTGKVDTFIENLVYKKTGWRLHSKGLQIKTHKNLTLSLLAKQVYIESEAKQLVTVDNLLLDASLVKKEVTNTKANIQFGDSKLTAKGKINLKNKNYDFKITGSDIPVKEIEETTLSLLKVKKPQKSFLENFDDFSGTIDVNLDVNNEGIFGECRIKGLQAKFLMFNVPVSFNDFTAHFTGDGIYTGARGLIGGEKLYSDFRLKNYKADERTISGSVVTMLTNDFTKEYMPDLSITGKVETSLRYYIKDSKPQISYLLKIRENSNLYYKHASLEMTDKNRRVFVRTEKEKDKLYIRHYDYSTQEGRKINNIVKGEALFEKKEGKMKPSYITCSTSNHTPVSVTGSFGKKLHGGTFHGDLKYDFKSNLLLGSFDLKSSSFNNFYIEEGKITADNKKMQISAKGTYFDSPFNGFIDMENKYRGTITVHNIDLFLDKFIVKKGPKPKKKKKKLKKPEDVDIIIENGRIRVNKVIRKNILVENIELLGSLKDDIVSFSMPNANFAKGKLRAKGSYNIDEHSAIIDFAAENIDSNLAAYMVFNLKNQIKGIANANLHANLKDRLHFVEANGNFTIKDGYLPQIGSTEFIIKKSKKGKKPFKVRVSDIINIDLSKSKALSSDLSGSFNIHNYDLREVKIYSKQKYLSLYIEGDYNLNKEDADVQMWGSYNKTQQNKVRVLFVPLSFIMKMLFKPEYTKEIYSNKLKAIPPISAKPEETESFRVKMNGNLNKHDNIKVELKSIH